VTAGTIISTDGQGNDGYKLLNGMFDEGGGWSQTGTYVNVTITVEIDPGTGSGTSGTAYLTTQVGPGTSVAQQIATAPFSATGAKFSPVLNTLFTGLTLGPGNYYLVLSSATGLGWEIATGFITPVADAGVSDILNADTSGNPLAAYPPTSIFGNTTGNLVEFTAIGTAVPEPSPMALIFSALVLIALVYWFKSSALERK
jgi:hypothetical protein